MGWTVRRGPCRVDLAWRSSYLDIEITKASLRSVTAGGGID
jgi:hypothetical protein